jgi:hypothetical protein
VWSAVVGLGADALPVVGGAVERLRSDPERGQGTSIAVRLST